MRSLSWLGWAALTSAAGIIYLALVLVPGPEPGPQLTDLTAAGEESEVTGEPDGPKLEPVEVIDLARVPVEPFPNSAEPPLADPPAGGVVQAVGFQPFDGPTLPVMPYCKDDAPMPSVRACGFEQPAGEELPCPCPRKNAPACGSLLPFVFGLFPQPFEPLSDSIHFGKAPNCSWTATAAPYYVPAVAAPAAEAEEQEAPAPRPPMSRRLRDADDPTHSEVDSAEVRPSDLPKNYGRTPF